MSNNESGSNESDGAECPTCGKVCNTNQGVQIHHATVHGESINFGYVECVCEWCEDTYEVKPSRKDETRFCSSECRDKNNSAERSGENNPKWCEKVELTCSHCGDTYKVIPSRAPRSNYCSMSCRGKGVDHDSLELVSLTCEYCGEEYEKYPSQADRSSYCSKECQWEQYKIDFSGENSPRWVDYPEVECNWCGETKKIRPSVVNPSGNHFCDKECFYSWVDDNAAHEYDQDYGPNWNDQREKRIQFDNEKCIRCGITRNQHRLRWGRDFPVHHIIKKESFRQEDGTLDHEEANRLSNLLTLCVKHHPDYEGIPIDTRHLSAADD